MGYTILLINILATNLITNYYRFMKKTILLFLSVAFGSNLLSQTASATWSLTSNGNASITGNITATAVIAGPGRYTPGIGSLSYTSDGVRSQNWNRATYTQFSITSQFYNQDYYQYTVSPTVGNDFNVNSITLQASASAATPSWYVFYSLDGFTTYTQIGGRNSTSLTGLNIDVPSGSTLTLRVFGMDLVASTTYFRNKNVVISGTTSSSCSSPDQPSSIGGNATLCANGTETYSVTNDPTATSYTWTLPSGWSGTSTTNSINVTYGTTGGTITVTADNACGSSIPQTANISVNNNIDKTVDLTGLTLTANQAGATYQWLDCDNGNAPISGETNQLFTPSANGNYAVEITLSGCTETSSCTVVNFVNISENVIDNLTVFPNPGNGIYTISGYNFQGDTDIKIYTSDGKMILQQSGFSGEDAIITIDISSHPQGIYLLEIDNHKSVFHSRIVKK